ncbi:hypothetical protein SAMN05216188_117107 [Lentzea xinjiangensis]|uniref:Uncharacterized protein n=1 Tax=Lentzea xinjiangensis TaxID=402600 RepID=A0A1H9T1Z1_9PSEU|nr:hypothetical protein [Lentzea xinjiangensis]SER91270.1 hypothetical protein SAMN05216188_117107 [Lentzea xinjiangensis]
MPDRTPVALSELTWREVCESFSYYRESATLHGLDIRFVTLASASPDHATVDEWSRLRKELDERDGLHDELVGKSGDGVPRRKARAMSEGDHKCPVGICDRLAFGNFTGEAPLCELTGKRMAAEHTAQLESSQSSSDAAR